jgi:phosphomannomutase
MTKPVLLFDIDNTLTPPRRPLNAEMAEVLKQLKYQFHVAAGSHYGILESQFFRPLADFGFKRKFHAFINNGARHCEFDYADGLSMKIISDFDFKSHLGEANYDFLIDVLKRAEQSPEFRIEPPLRIVGDTIGLRGSMINFVPIGRKQGERDDADYREARDQFVEFDERNGYRLKLLRHLNEELAGLMNSHDLTISLGGQTSFDLSIKNRDKSNAVWSLLEMGVEKIIFIGDALFENGNDATIKRVVDIWPDDSPCPLSVIQVSGWENTIDVLSKLPASVDHETHN